MPQVSPCYSRATIVTAGAWFRPPSAVCHLPSAICHLPFGAVLRRFTASATMLGYRVMSFTKPVESRSRWPHLASLLGLSNFDNTRTQQQHQLVNLESFETRLTIMLQPNRWTRLEPSSVCELDRDMAFTAPIDCHKVL